ncbi:MAG: hypothetical protein ANIMEMIM_00232 [Candidatus Argoarchaeum ethanivorans]|uniref:Uncharacterized protein n=1 Tax=Candidatus Argoarchaeum ethanivorans TaxID=2608793 RepID=A0A811T3L3_9EURY|nr:MAG: hypothetical protein ANIMEMIM_00232 [Candidatus Argoarchaeum ethanivorans]
MCSFEHLHSVTSSLDHIPTRHFDRSHIKTGLKMSKSNKEFNKPFNTFWTIDYKRLLARVKRKRLNQTGNSENMIGMEVGDKNRRDIQHSTLSLHHSLLCSFTAVKQQQLAFMINKNTRGISFRSGKRTSSAKKNDLQH